MIKPIFIKDKNKNLKFKISIWLFVLLAMVYFLDMFFDNYDLRFQSPVIIRTPILIEKRIKVKPAGSKRTTKSNAQKKSTAQLSADNEKQKITIKSYPKLMDKKNLELREKIIFYLKTKIKNENEIIAIDNIFKKETGYDPTVVNEIGAGGLCQAYPHTKMNCELSWEDWKCQVDWCLKYIENRYKNPVDAWNFHLINDWF